MIILIKYPKYPIIILYYHNFNVDKDAIYIVEYPKIETVEMLKKFLFSKKSCEFKKKNGSFNIEYSWFWNSEIIVFFISSCLSDQLFMKKYTDLKRSFPGTT